MIKLVPTELKSYAYGYQISPFVAAEETHKTLKERAARDLVTHVYNTLEENSSRIIVPKIEITHYMCVRYGETVPITEAEFDKLVNKLDLIMSIKVSVRFFEAVEVDDGL